MRINVDIDDDLVHEAMRLTGAPTRRAAVEKALRTLIRVRRLAGFFDYIGQLKLSPRRAHRRLRQGA